MVEENAENETKPVAEQLTEPENQIQALLTRATEREQKARRRAFYWTLIPAALALLLLMGTGLEMRSANQAVRYAQSELVDTEKEIQSLNLELDNTREELDTANEEVHAANQALTETLETLEVVTGDLVTTQDILARTEIEYEGLQKEYDALQIRVNQYNEEIGALKEQIDDLQDLLDSVNDELKAAIRMSNYRFEGDWMLTVKYIATEFPSAGTLLQSIVELEDVPWQRRGFSVETGFDSPSFAAYVLQVSERIGEEGSEVRYNLRTHLPARNGGPQVGDIVFYEGGYTMFYFIDERGVPFVIGMTTQGVLALTPDFAPVIGYGVTEL
jgi:hypothetical protein